MKYYTIIQFCSLLTLVHSELADPDWMLLQELHYKGWPESRRELGCWRQVKYKLEDNANSFDNLGLCAQMFEHTLRNMGHYALLKGLKDKEFGVDWCVRKLKHAHQAGYNCLGRFEYAERNWPEEEIQPEEPLQPPLIVRTLVSFYAYICAFGVGMWLAS